MEILKFNKKGVSGAISAMFIIAIFFMALVSIFIVMGLNNSYNQTVLDRNRMDWERDSESIFFIAAEVKVGVLNLNFSNNGRVTLHLVQVWLSQFPNRSYSQCTNQSQYWTSKYVSSGETVNSFGATQDFRRVYIGSIGIPIRLSGLPGIYCKIKLVTERGNVFECQVPWPPPSGGEGTVGGYVLQIESADANFQYSFNTMTGWDSAFIKIRHKDPPIVYRILIRNTTSKNIVLLEDTCMLQIGTGQVGTSRRWFICQPDPTGTSYLPLNPTIWPNPPNPPAFTYQMIPRQSVAYVYFAIAPDETWNHPGTDWQTDPPYSSQQFSLMSCVMWFVYEGETEVRNVQTMVLVQVLNPP